MEIKNGGLARNLNWKQKVVFEFYKSSRILALHESKLILIDSRGEISLSFTWLLGKELAGLVDAGLEEVVVLHDQLDVGDWQIDEHTSDLRGLWSDELVDELVQDGSDLVLVVGVLGDDGRQDLVAGHDESLVHGQLLLDLLLLLAQLLLLLLHGLHLSLVRHHVHVLLHGTTELVLHLVAHHASSALASASPVGLGWLLALGSSFVVSHLLATLRSD